MWADVYVLNWSNGSTSSSTHQISFSSGFVINNETKDYARYSSTEYVKYSNVLHTITGIPSGHAIKSVKFEGYQNGDNGSSYFTNFNGISYTETTSPHSFGGRKADATSYTFTGLNVVSGNSISFSLNKETDLEITITTEQITIDNLYDSYPYTWDFTVERSKWSKSISEMKASGSGNNWSFNDGETEARPTMALSTDTSLDDIDIIKGLRFGTNNAADLCLDWTTHWMWLNGTVQLPSLAKGHVVTFHSQAAPTSIPEGVTQVSSADGLHVYKATAAVASPGFTFGGTGITKIEVTKTTLTDFRRGGSSANVLRDGGTLNLNGTNSGFFYVYHDELISTGDISVTVDNDHVSVGDLNQKSGDAKQDYFYVEGHSVGSSTITISYAGSEGINPASIILHLNVVQSASPKKWNFEDASYWRTPSGDLNASYWVESADATANPGEVMSNVAFNNTELTKDGTNVLPETQGLVMTAVQGSSRFKIGSYYRLGNHSKASITIPYVTTGQTVTFKVETATSGMERGITAVSNNLELISGQVSDKVSYFTYRVTNDGDAVFRQTSDDAGLKIYYIDLKAATPAATELKFVDASGNDISNTQVNIPSGITGNLNSYFRLSKSDATDWSNIEVFFDGSIISADNSSSWAGSFTLSSSKGVATITARTTNGTTETGVAVLYVSVKDLPTVTLSANGPFTVNYGQDFNDNTSTVTGTSSAGLPVKYKSSNERVAKVNASGHVTCVGVGTATITAYTEETETYLPAEASYQVTYNAGNVIFQFEPSEVKLALGKNITPYLHYDQKGQLDPATLTFSLSKSDVVTCEVVTDAKESDKNVIKITSVDNASRIGETVIVTASAKMKNSSVVYNTTIAVTITAADAINFDWLNGAQDIYVYENFYLPIPRIRGNASGNNHFSNGPDNASTHHGYVYEIKKGSITWNNNSYHLNEGVPDFYLTDENGNATTNGYIFWAHSDNSLYGDTLLVYTKTAGQTLLLHAKDTQTDVECSPIRIHILTNNLDVKRQELVSSAGYPYTWDFTKEIDETVLENNLYWDKIDDTYRISALWQNTDFADNNSNNMTSDKITRNFIGNGGTNNAGAPMVLFKGMKLQLGNSTYTGKIHKLRILPNAGEGEPKLYVEGGPHWFYLPRLGDDSNEPETYKLFLKVKVQEGNVQLDMRAGERSVSYESGKNTWPGERGVRIFSFDVNKGEEVSFAIQNMYVYWVALSTEAKSVNTHPTTKNAAATYSYPEDLDFDKSLEANNELINGSNLKAYTVSGYSTNSVTLTQVPEGGVKADQGLVLKADINTDKNYYMVANPRNVETYSELSVISPNYLVATSDKIGQKILSSEEIEGETWSNFLLSKKYTRYKDDFETVIQADITTRDWAFYRMHTSTPNAPASMAYLHVQGDTYGHYNQARSMVANRAGSPESVLLDELLYLTFVDRDGNTETTSIEAVNTEPVRALDNEDEAWYTLQGMRVITPVKGSIYIRKGKKVVVK